MFLVVRTTLTPGNKMLSPLLALIKIIVHSPGFKSYLIVIFQAKLLSIAETTGLMRLNHPQRLELLPTQDPKSCQVFPFHLGDHLEEEAESKGKGWTRALWTLHPCPQLDPAPKVIIMTGVISLGTRSRLPSFKSWLCTY